MKLTPSLFIAGSIGDHEGGLSLHPEDNGNWYDSARYLAKPKQLPQARNCGTLVGSKFGVCAYPLVRYRMIKGMKQADAVKVTKADMDAITFDKAVDIGVTLYFNQPGFNRLPWNRVTASIFDKAWGSGPGTSIGMVQKMVGSPVTHVMNDDTVAKFAMFCAKYGEEGAAFRWCDQRIAFDTALTTNQGANDPDKKFINGWNNRSRSFLPNTKWWNNA